MMDIRTIFDSFFGGNLVEISYQKTFTGFFLLFQKISRVLLGQWKDERIRLRMFDALKAFSATKISISLI
jgi:hypothetical protein